ncbi:Uncharacterised protein [Bordetella pertussis]|nr:Uncharacterised protein [Bordetella pertussis]CFW01429.1 Uncharacterised protein [Bordetella pertussis]
MPEKYASTTRPVRSCSIRPWPSCSSFSHIAAVRRSCQTMARASGRPVARSQIRVVSRWLVMPSAARSAALAPALRSASRATSSWLCQISPASCSTQPGRG